MLDSWKLFGCDIHTEEYLDRKDIFVIFWVGNSFSSSMKVWILDGQIKLKEVVRAGWSVD